MNTWLIRAAQMFFAACLLFAVALVVPAFVRLATSSSTDPWNDFWLIVVMVVFAWACVMLIRALPQTPGLASSLDRYRARFDYPDFDPGAALLLGTGRFGINGSTATIGTVAIGFHTHAIIIDKDNQEWLIPYSAVTGIATGRQSILHGWNGKRLELSLHDGIRLDLYTTGAEVTPDRPPLDHIDDWLDADPHTASPNQLDFRQLFERLRELVRQDTDLLLS